MPIPTLFGGPPSPLFLTLLLFITLPISHPPTILVSSLPLHPRSTVNQRIDRDISIYPGNYTHYHPHLLYLYNCCPFQGYIHILLSCFCLYQLSYSSSSIFLLLLFYSTSGSQVTVSLTVRIPVPCCQPRGLSTHLTVYLYLFLLSCPCHVPGLDLHPGPEGQPGEITAQCMDSRDRHDLA